MEFQKGLVDFIETPMVFNELQLNSMDPYKIPMEFSDFQWTSNRNQMEFKGIQWISVNHYGTSMGFSTFPWNSNGFQ